MPRTLWPLWRGRPTVEIVLTRVSDGQPQLRRLLADTGAGTSRAGFELLLTEADSLMGGGAVGRPTVLGGAYIGQFPVYLIHVQIPSLGVRRAFRAVAVPTPPTGFDGIACFAFLNQFTYGNFGDPTQFGLET